MTAQAIPDLSHEQLAELDDRMKAAKQQRSNRERAERGRRQLLRQTQAKLHKVATEVTKVRADRDAKIQTVVMLRERLEGVEEQNQHDAQVRDERLALVDAIDMAVQKGAPVVSGVTCPSNLRPYRLLFDAARRHTNWRTPIAELGRILETLTAEQTRLSAQLEELEAA